MKPFRKRGRQRTRKGIVFVPSITRQNHLLYLLHNRDSDHGPACAYHRAVTLQPMNLTPGLRLSRPFASSKVDGSQRPFGPGASGMVRAPRNPIDSCANHLLPGTGSQALAACAAATCMYGVCTCSIRGIVLRTRTTR